MAVNVPAGNCNQAIQKAGDLLGDTKKREAIQTAGSAYELLSIMS